MAAELASGSTVPLHRLFFVRVFQMSIGAVTAAALLIAVTPGLKAKRAASPGDIHQGLEALAKWYPEEGKRAEGLGRAHATQPCSRLAARRSATREPLN
jgi:hypothetical protein